MESDISNTAISGALRFSRKVVISLLIINDKSSLMVSVGTPSAKERVLHGTLLIKMAVLYIETEGIRGSN